MALFSRQSPCEINIFHFCLGRSVIVKPIGPPCSCHNSIASLTTISDVSFVTWTTKETISNLVLFYTQGCTKQYQIKEFTLLTHRLISSLFLQAKMECRKCKIKATARKTMIWVEPPSNLSQILNNKTAMSTLKDVTLLTKSNMLILPD